ncbi:MAG TPA: FAD-dependent oxidoreductase, partial [Caulobacteraceae bacterium]|nr:FAD-dependent oxidoreductase [Caulobacteraceae bacterium]
RAHTLRPRPDLPLDAGAGWLHSADVNPLVPMIETAGFAIDHSMPAWEKQAGNQDFPPDDQDAFAEAFAAFDRRLEEASRAGRDRPAADLLAPDCRWNVLIDAVSAYYNGAEFDRVSVKDYAAYEDTDVNWRVREGYGAAVAALGAGVEVVTGCAVQAIDHGAAPIRLITAKGALTARAAVLTAPTPHLAEGRIAFTPDLPDKREAAVGLPLGLANKVFLGLDDAHDLPADGHLFGRIDRTETGSYTSRPFSRPYIEGFLGGRHARGLEGEGAGAATAFAVEELVGLLGSGVRRRLAPLIETAWASDPWSLGAYSHALPGRADARAVLAAPTDGRLFWAGEATSATAFSTVHGAWESGERAADEVLAALRP